MPEIIVQTERDGDENLVNIFLWDTIGLRLTWEQANTLYGALGNEILTESMTDREHPEPPDFQEELDDATAAMLEEFSPTALAERYRAERSFR